MLILQEEVETHARRPSTIHGIETVLMPRRSSTINGYEITHAARRSSTINGIEIVQVQHEVQKGIRHNWSGIKCIAREDQIRYPKTELEIVELVKSAKTKVHVIGSGLSYEKLMSLSITDPDGILLSLRDITGLLRTTETTATFAAATPINDVIAELSGMERKLTCSLGVIGIQTLAGAMSTGTHGQGLFQSDFGTSVASLKVVLPSGEVRTIRETDEDLPLGAFVTSLGTLGVITEVEIRTEPRRVFHCRKVTLPYEDFLASYVRWNNDYENVKVWWFPATDLCHVWLVKTAEKPETDAFLATDRAVPLQLANKDGYDRLGDTVKQYLNTMSHDTKAAADSDEPRFETVRRFADAVDLVGYYEQILCKGIPAPQVNCEIAVPLDRFREATEALHEWSFEQSESSLHYPFIYRATGQSSAWLSPSYVGPMVWIGFLVYVADDGTVRGDGMDTMDALQQILRKFNGLPHWGKHFLEQNFDFEELLEKFPDFIRLRRNLDPTNKMLGQFLENTFK